MHTPEAGRASLPDRYVAAVAAGVEQALGSQLEDGHFRSAPAYTPFHPIDQTAVYPLAFLYVTEHPLNPFEGDSRLIESAARAGDYLVCASDEEGRIHFNSAGYDVLGVNQWLWHAWIEAVVLLERHLGAARTAAWREALAAGAETLAETLRGFNAQAKFHTRSFETSPNHAALYAAFVYRAGMVFDRADWRATVDEFMSKFIPLQDADGCWPEYEGPVINYAFMTLSGVGLYGEYTGSIEVRRAVERTIDWFTHVFYPDGSPASVLDGRIQGAHAASPFGHFALSLSPEGRALCELITRDWLGPKPPGPWVMTHAVENFQYWHPGPVGRLPVEGEAFTHRMRRTAGVRKEGPWVWTLSGIITPEYTDSPWSLDRQTLLELHHASAGPVLNGSNCKEHREAATFASAQTPDDALPVESRLDEQASHLEVVCRTFKAELSVRADSPSQFTVLARVSDCREGDTVNFHLQPAAQYGATVALDGVERTLGAERFSIEGVRTLAWAGVSLSFDAPARVWWPMEGYNSYSADHRYADLHPARLIAEVALTPAAPACTVVARVG